MCVQSTHGKLCRPRGALGDSPWGPAKPARRCLGPKQSVSVLLQRALLCLSAAYAPLRGQGFCRRGATAPHRYPLHMQVPQKRRLLGPPHASQPASRTWEGSAQGRSNSYSGLATLLGQGPKKAEPEARIHTPVS